MNEWQETTLGKICSKIGSGATPKGGQNAYKLEGISLIRSQNILDLSFSTDGLAFIDEEQADKLKNVTISENDVLLNITGDSVARVCRVPSSVLPARVNQHVSIIRCLTEVANNDYILYLLQYEKPQLLSLASAGATRNALTKEMLEKYPVKLPPLPEQKAIADTLSILDRNIELNNQVNQVLEEMAQAIFKSWFVDFEPFGGEMPADWEVGTLSDVAKITMGQSPAGKTYNEVGDGAVFYQGRGEFSKRFPTRRLFTTEPKRYAEENSVLMSVRAPVGDVNVAFERCCIGRGLASIESKSGYASFILYTMMSLKQELDVFNGDGTVFGSINKDSMHQLPVLVPTEEKIQEFESIVSPLDEVIRNNYQETQTLTEIRNTLLPKLMSGEVRVPLVEVE